MAGPVDPRRTLRFPRHALQTSACCLARVVNLSNQARTPNKSPSQRQGTEKKRRPRDRVADQSMAPQIPRYCVPQLLSALQLATHHSEPVPSSFGRQFLKFEELVPFSSPLRPASRLNWELSLRHFSQAMRCDAMLPSSTLLTSLWLTPSLPFSPHASTATASAVPGILVNQGDSPPSVFRCPISRSVGHEVMPYAASAHKNRTIVPGLVCAPSSAQHRQPTTVLGHLATAVVLSSIPPCRLSFVIFRSPKSKHLAFSLGNRKK